MLLQTSLSDIMSASDLITFILTNSETKLKQGSESSYVTVFSTIQVVQLLVQYAYLICETELVF